MLGGFLLLVGPFRFSFFSFDDCYKSTRVSLSILLASRFFIDATFFKLHDYL